jgi:hypothetical protein
MEKTVKMELQKIIVPREKRVIIYTILHGEIINDNQKKEYQEKIKVNIAKIQEKRNNCISLTTEKENLYSFVYVHVNGEMETQINVIRPKYPFHEKYNNTK